MIIRRKTNEEFVREIYELVDDEYEFLEEYISNKTKIQCKHNVCEHIYKVRPDNFFSGYRCPKCNGGVKYSHEDYCKKVYDLVGDEYTVLGKYKNAGTKIKMIHNICCNIWETTPRKFLSGRRCPQCNGGTAYTNSEFIDKVYQIVEHEYKFLEEYINSNIKIKCKHNNCGYIWGISPAKFLSGRRCPQCNETKGEQRVREYLESRNIKYIREYSFQDCKNKQALLFDFYLSDYHLLIEYDGEQHFEPIDFFGGQEKFEQQQINDNIKNLYCINKNIKLLRIPYWEFDNIGKILEGYLNNVN